jgi:hypothetical protein
LVPDAKKSFLAKLAAAKPDFAKNSTPKPFRQGAGEMSKASNTYNYATARRAS